MAIQLRAMHSISSNIFCWLNLSQVHPDSKGWRNIVPLDGECQGHIVKKHVVVEDTVAAIFGRCSLPYLKEPLL